MTIDINTLSEHDLIDLNHRIVERLRFLQLARSHVAMLNFRIGQRVWFEPEGRGRVYGVVTRYNKKSVSVLSADGHRWTVAPVLLHAESEHAEPSAATDQKMLGNS